MNLNEDGSALVAVYGTLRKDCGNHVILDDENVEYLGEAKTEPKFTMFHLGGFPGVAERGDTSITIEVYKVKSEKIINRLNRLEGYSGIRGSSRNWYDTTDVVTPYGVANMYVMNQLDDKTTKVTHGDWKNRNNK